jgi:hypothetical protein
MPALEPAAVYDRRVSSSLSLKVESKAESVAEVEYLLKGSMVS